MKKVIIPALAVMFLGVLPACDDAGNKANAGAETEVKKDKKGDEKSEKKKKEDKIKSIEIGAQPESLNFNVKDTDGNESTLKSHAGDNGLLVIFSCNTCPFVVAWEDRYNEVKEFADAAGVGTVLLNSNEDFRDDDDSPEAIAAHAEELGYTMPYLIDENHKIADDFGAKTTPHVFLFDAEGTLVYRGAIDDNYEDKSAVEQYYLKDALAAFQAGETINPETTKALGCSIKRLKK